MKSKDTFQFKVLRLDSNISASKFILNGVIRNCKGEPIPGAKVKILSLENVHCFLGISDSIGGFKTSLDRGIYTIDISTNNRCIHLKDKFELSEKGIYETQIILFKNKRRRCDYLESKIKLSKKDLNVLKGKAMEECECY